MVEVRSWKSAEPVSVEAFLRSWLHQPHMPNVTVGYDHLQGEYVLRQVCPILGCARLWYLPIRSYSPRLRSASPSPRPQAPQPRLVTDR